MPLSPEELARRRVVNQAAHRKDIKARARTPMERATAAWDHWRALMREVPADQVEPWAEAITNTLEANIERLTKLLTPEGDRK